MDLIRAVLHYETYPKVSKLDMIFIIYQDVLWLDVPMDYSCIFMAILDCYEQLTEVLPDLGLGELRLLVDLVLKSAIRDVFVY